MAGRPRITLPMTDEEICREYREAKYPSKQVKILADENACSVGKIVDVLKRAGVYPPPAAESTPPEDPAEKGDSKMNLKEFQAAAAAPEKTILPAPPQVGVLREEEPQVMPGFVPWQDAAEGAAVSCGVGQTSPSPPALVLTGPQLRRVFYQLGILRGVLDASAEAGRPGEVMKDALDELEIVLTADAAP